VPFTTFAFKSHIQNMWAVKHGKIIIWKVTSFTYLPSLSVIHTVSPLLGIWWKFVITFSIVFYFQHFKSLFNVFIILSTFFTSMTLCTFSFMDDVMFSHSGLSSLCLLLTAQQTFHLDLMLLQSTSRKWCLPS